MTKEEAIKKCNDAGIYQLNAGESLQDCLDHIDGKLPSRKGYRFKADNGRRLSRNEIITEANKEAFCKTVRTPEYKDHPFTSLPIDQIPAEAWNAMEDYRESKDQIGVVLPCQYCGTPIRADYEGQYDIFNCDDCHGHAILKNCM